MHMWSISMSTVTKHTFGKRRAMRLIAVLHVLIALPLFLDLRIVQAALAYFLVTIDGHRLDFLRFHFFGLHCGGVLFGSWINRGRPIARRSRHEGVLTFLALLSSSIVLATWIVQRGGEFRDKDWRR